MPANIKRLKDRHFIIMSLQAAGYSLTEISLTLNMSIGYLSQLTSSPLYLSEMEILRRRFRQSMEDDLRHAILAEAKPSLQTIKEIRDDKAAPKSVRLRASETFLDRNLITAKIMRGSTLPTVDEGLTDQQIEEITKAFAVDNLAKEALAEARASLENIELEGHDEFDTFDDEIDSSSQTGLDEESTGLVSNDLATPDDLQN